MSKLFTVAIDPGHPSRTGDVGCHHGLLIEKDYTLEIGLRLREQILTRNENIGVLMTRWQDEVVDFPTRMGILQNATPHLTLSLHVDSISDKRTCGMQAFRLLGDALGHTVGKVIVEKLDRVGRYVNASGTEKKRQAPVAIARQYDLQGKPHWTRNAHAVLARYTPGGEGGIKACYAASVVLVEMGFATNQDDLAFLLSEEGKEQVVGALEAGVMHAYQEFDDV